MLLLVLLLLLLVLVCRFGTFRFKVGPFLALGGLVCSLRVWDLDFGVRGFSRESLENKLRFPEVLGCGFS